MGSAPLQRAPNSYRKPRGAAITGLHHGARRTHGTGALYARFRTAISRRELPTRTERSAALEWIVWRASVILQYRRAHGRRRPDAAWRQAAESWLRGLSRITIAHNPNVSPNYPANDIENRLVAHEAGHQGAHSYRDIKWFDKVSIEMISLEKAKVGFSISPFIGKLSFEFDIIKILDPKYNVNLLS